MSDNLANLYPSLSDDEEEVKPVNSGNERSERDQVAHPQCVPRKIIKPNEAEANTNLPPKVCMAPPIFGAKTFVPPPPPPNAKKYIPPTTVSMPPPTTQPSRVPPTSFSEPQQRPQNQGPRPERKNCVFVRNIPKYYNESDKLMTFFKNQGQIKEIKVNHEDSSAMVRFVRQENAMRFVSSGKAILNRSFITYGFNERETVPAELVNERINDQSDKPKKPEFQMKQIRQKVQNLLVCKMRAILFLKKNLPAQSRHHQYLTALFDQTLYLKNNFAKYSFEQMLASQKIIMNEFDWTIRYTLRSTSEIQEKSYQHMLFKNIGAVGDLELTELTPDNVQQIEGGPKIYDYVVRVTFVSPKHAWQFYCNPNQRQEKDLVVEGEAMWQIFNEGSLNVPLHYLYTTQQEPEIQNLVEIDENGNVRILDWKEEQNGQEKQPEQEAQPEEVKANEVQEKQEQKSQPVAENDKAQDVAIHEVPRSE